MPTGDFARTCTLQASGFYIGTITPHSAGLAGRVLADWGISRGHVHFKRQGFTP
ncbi:MAG: hypothetical protein IJR63_09925 [Synergistaceae bacterium]|nr:hypothetical protein [Synergistaceae bacterium]